MPRLEAETDGPAWDALREAVGALGEIAARPRADLVDLGKAYARVAEAIDGVAAAAGQKSLRFEAARRALDLHTPRSKIAAFLED